MRVFKTCMIIAKKRLPAILIYFVMFMTIFVFVARIYAENNSTAFSESNVEFTVINRDQGSEFSKAVTDYLSTKGKQVEIEDKKESIQDAAFFGATEYILIIPKGFEESFFSGDDSVKLEKILTELSSGGVYADSMVNQFYKVAKSNMVVNRDLSKSEILKAALKDLEAEAKVEKKSFSGGSMDMTLTTYFKMSSYFNIIMLISAVSSVTIAFNRPEVKMRNLSSPLRPRDMNREFILTASIFGAAVWLLTVLIAFIMYSGRFMLLDIRLVTLLLVNSAIFIIVILTLSILLSSFVTNSNTQNAIGNFVSLVFCFLGGIFVPIELIGEKILMFSYFTPTYWFGRNVDMIGKLSIFSFENLKPILFGALIQLLFAVCFFTVSLVVRKYYDSSEKRFFVNKTELEA